MPHPNDPTLRSFIPVDPTSDFPIQNLPYGVFSTADCADARASASRSAITCSISAVLESEGLIDLSPAFDVFAQADRSMPSWRWGRRSGRARARGSANCCATTIRSCATTRAARARAGADGARSRLHLPIAVAGYTDFYSSKEHATNVGVMFRGKDNALQPNWLHMPIGYNGRASTVVVSGTKVRRPRGQLKPPSAEVPSFGPCKRLDFELEMGVVVGQPSRDGRDAHRSAGGGDDLRLCAAERLERARYPAMGIRAARAVPGQGVCDLDQPVGRDARGAGAVPGAGPGAGSGAAALSAAGAAEQLRSAARCGLARRADERGHADLPHQFQIHVLVVGAATGASRLLRLRHECRRSLRVAAPSPARKRISAAACWKSAGTAPSRSNSPAASSGRSSKTAIRWSCAAGARATAIASALARSRARSCRRSELVIPGRCEAIQTSDAQLRIGISDCFVASLLGNDDREASSPLFRRNIPDPR